MADTLHQQRCPVRRSRPYSSDLLGIATTTLASDNEENALTSLRIIFDLHKNYRPALEGNVQTFLNLVQRICECALRLADCRALSFSHGPSPPRTTDRSLNKTMARVFGGDEAAAETERLPSSRSTLQGTESFKVLTECPLIVMLVFQLYLCRWSMSPAPTRAHTRSPCPPHQTKSSLAISKRTFPSSSR